MTGNPKQTEVLWDNFCRLRLQSRAYRAVDDPIVAVAYGDWLASYLADSVSGEISLLTTQPKASNVIPFRKKGARA
jgi:hypothetical protein